MGGKGSKCDEARLTRDLFLETVEPALWDLETEVMVLASES